jgi:MurNAc alpha-1-phosphate uridylyltransferase
MKAMILAAGFGERLRPLTETTPKPLLRVGGKPLIQYHIENLATVGVRDVVINTGWLGDQVEAFVGDGSRFGVSVQWSREADPLETGGGIRNALPLLGSEPFLVINSDVWTDYPIEKLIAIDWSAEDIDAHLVLVGNPEHHPEGDFELSSDGKVTCPQGGESYTFSGISVMSPEIFALYPSASQKFPIRDVLAGSIKSGFVSGEVFDGIWQDIGTIERLNALDELLSGREVTLDIDENRGKLDIFTGSVA